MICSWSNIRAIPWILLVSPSLFIHARLTIHPASFPAGKTHIAKAIQHPVYAAEGPKIHNGSHVFVFCARTTMGYRSGENGNANLLKYHLPVGAVIFNL
jgi:hypothetical protein